MKSGQELVPNVWSVIFSNLEPCFLAKVMCVSKSFNAAASSDTVFFNKMKCYFPDAYLQTTAVPASEHKAKSLFKIEYAKRFATLTSSASRRLLSFIIEADLEQIRKFPVDGDRLFDMLVEEDADGNDMFFYINRANRADLNEAIMMLYVRSAVARVQSWNPFTILDNWLDKICRTVFGLPLNNNECIRIFEMGGAFNLQVISGLEKIPPDSYRLYDDALAMAVRFGHRDAVELLLGFSARFERDGTHFTPIDKQHPLVVAARYGQPEIASRLLAIAEIAADDFILEKALSAATKHYCPKVFELLLQAYFNLPDNRPQNSHDFISRTLLDKMAESSRVDSFAMVFKKMEYLPMINGYVPPDFLTLHFWDMKMFARTASQSGCVAIVDLVLKKIMTAESEKNIQRFMAQVITAAVENCKIDLVKLYLSHGYVPDKGIVKYAKDLRYTEIVKLLSDAREDHKQEKMRKLAP